MLDIWAYNLGKRGQGLEILPLLRRGKAQEVGKGERKKEMKTLSELFAECLRKDGYSHESCPAWLDSSGEGEAYQVCCECPCHKAVEQKEKTK